MKKVCVLYSEYSPIIDAIKYTLADYEVDCLSQTDGGAEYDLVINLCPKNFDTDGIACHHSLLPAFDGDEPEKEAMLAGVKVTGITVYYTKTKKIVAQYPIFVKPDTHYDELKQELIYLEQTILPIAAKKILEEEPFDVSLFLNKGCGGNCGGCSSCSH